MTKYIINHRNGLSLDEYRRFAERSAKAGATHINVSQIEKSIWQWNVDRTDPYPNWSISLGTLFKFIVPEGLRDYLPLDYAKRNEDALAARAEIIKEFGLRASFTGVEPAFLPEKVFVDHPEWRGPRCDQPRRARNEFYSPCIDNLEVLSMYKEATEKLCRIAPIEMFNFLTNDSGGGVCWSELLYPGKNGPKSCRHIGFGERISKFMSTIQAGAKEAGVKTVISFNNNYAIVASEVTDAVGYMKEGQFVNGRGAVGSKESIARIGGGAAFDGLMYTPSVMSVARDMGRLDEKAETVILTVTNVDDEELFDFIGRALKTPPKGVYARAKILHETAANFIGEETADELLTIWEDIESGINATSALNCGGHVFWIGAVHQRWLTRPFVAFPGELTPEERDYYRNFQFQAGTEEDANNMLDMQACRFVNGYSGTFLAGRTIERSLTHLRNALRRIRALKAKMAGHAYEKQLKKLEIMVRMLICVSDNAMNVFKFQDILDRADYSDLPAKDKTPVWSEQGDPHYAKIKGIFRDEIDNTLEIISLLEQADGPVLRLAPTKDLEDVMTLGPDITDQLKKKISIMRAHVKDFDRLLKSFNR